MRDQQDPFKVSTKQVLIRIGIAIVGFAVLCYVVFKLFSGFSG